MNTEKRDLFIQLWRKFFNESELPIAFYYSDSNNGVRVVEQPQGHRCLISQLNSVRKGESLCFTPESITCMGGKFYTGFANALRPRFEHFISHGEEGERCERYKRTPEQVVNALSSLPVLPRKGDYLIFKRWDTLTENDSPAALFFFATPDVLAGLFSLASFDSIAEDRIIAPFGAGCTSIIYYPYREEQVQRERAVIGMFDPSARKCIKRDITSFAVPITLFMKMIEQMEQSFLTEEAWHVIQKRI